MALGQACLAVFWLGSRRPWILVESFGLLTVVGIATLVAGGVGAPTTVRYWLVLAASLVVLAPVGLLARRLGRVRLQR
ncbi:MAG TPA: hypothetical protein VFA05_04745 [Gaiellaceae bacterium]|nr:hypothetical protein [Gaiellaceae bacterium]